MIVLAPVGDALVKVEDGVEFDPHAVPAPIDDGDAFIAVVCGAGARVTATAVPSMVHV
ncbi:MAG: hypothetical protein QOD02_3060, partial [Mycobacterium sp.]|nr:hypothetical protein [Mycobacterium sp.]